jgi:hypothetical protein
MGIKPTPLDGCGVDGCEMGVDGDGCMGIAAGEDG